MDLVRAILNDPPSMSLLPVGVYSPEINEVIEGEGRLTSGLSTLTMHMYLENSSHVNMHAQVCW